MLLISAFNYLNITLIRAPRRLKNLAGQRIMGASKAQIARQIISETALNVLVGFGIACLFMQSAMNLFNSFMGSNLHWQELLRLNNLPYLLVLLSILIIIPACYLIIKFNIKKPMEVFKNPSGNKIQYLGSLVVLQMIISVVLIAFSINVKKQMDYIVSIVPDAHQIICVEENQWWMSLDFVDHVRQSATTSEFLAGSIKPGTQSSDGKIVFLFNFTEPGFFDFLKIPIIAGRIFDSIPTEIKQVVVNKAFVKSREIEDDPLGYEFKAMTSTYRVVGVCEDFATESATLNVPPIIYTLSEGNYAQWKFYLRFSGSIDDKINDIKSIFDTYTTPGEKDVFGRSLSMPKISTMAEYYINLNPEVNRLRIMVTFFACISIFLSAMGLFGLSWYTVERRHKEMALRKVHGATTGKLLVLLCKTFFMWCAIATIIALPVGYFISRFWLQRFVYKIDNSLWTLLFTALIAAGVTFLTVIFQIMRAARANPAKYIKME